MSYIGPLKRFWVVQWWFFDFTYLSIPPNMTDGTTIHVPRTSLYFFASLCFVKQLHSCFLCTLCHLWGAWISCLASLLLLFPGGQNLHHVRGQDAVSPLEPPKIGGAQALGLFPLLKFNQRHNLQLCTILAFLGLPAATRVNQASVNCSHLSLNTMRHMWGTLSETFI